MKGKRENSKVEQLGTISAYEPPVVLPLGSAAKSLGGSGCPPTGSTDCPTSGSGNCGPSGSQDSGIDDD
jgi:hypothetical protein